MMHGKHICLFAVLLILYNVSSQPLDVIAGKSGEEQVKEALDRAEKEAVQASKETSRSTNTKEKDETASFLSMNEDKDSESGKNTRSSTDLKTTLDKKVEELAKFHEKHKTGKEEVHVEKDNKEKEVAEFKKGGKEISEEIVTAETKEKENAALEEESDKKMVEMAKKLNNLVLKFQKKMGRLSHRPKNAEELLPEKERDGDGESTVKSIRGKPATHAPIDLSALRNALGLLRNKGVTKTADDSSAKTSYKEDTKLEDRLAMEAEEEKKFSNGDTYDDGGEDDKSTASTNSAVSSLTPKEQASQEMQNYNALISSESNRELSQIQDEITKATQTSMGQVSVVGQKEQISTEVPQLPGLNEPALNGLGGAGALGGGAGLGGTGGLGELAGATEQFQGIQNVGTDGLESAAASSTAGAMNPQQAGQQITLGGNQTPIEIGSSQSPVEMGSIGASSNPFSNSQTNQMEGLQTDQLQNSFMSQGGQQAIDLGQGGEQQQSMTFKKSKISNKMKKNSKRMREVHHKPEERKSQGARKDH